MQAVSACGLLSGVWGARPPRTCGSPRRSRSDVNQHVTPEAGPVLRAGRWEGGLGGRAALPPLGPLQARHATDRAERDSWRLGPSEVRERGGCYGPFQWASSRLARSGPHGCGPHCRPADLPARASLRGHVREEWCEPKLGASASHSELRAASATHCTMPPAGIRGRFFECRLYDRTYRGRSRRDAHGRATNDCMNERIAEGHRTAPPAARVRSFRDNDPACTARSRGRRGGPGGEGPPESRRAEGPTKNVRVIEDALSKTAPHRGRSVFPPLIVQSWITVVL